MYRFITEQHIQIQVEDNFLSEDDVASYWRELINSFQMENLVQNALDGGPIPDVLKHLNFDNTSSTLFDLLMSLSDDCGAMILKLVPYIHGHTGMFLPLTEKVSSPHTYERGQFSVRYALRTDNAPITAQTAPELNLCRPIFLTDEGYPFWIIELGLAHFDQLLYNLLNSMRNNDIHMARGQRYNKWKALLE